MSLDQAFPQSAAHVKPRLDAGHLAAVVLVIIAKKMQQSVQRQDAKFGLKPVSGVLCLTPRYPERNHDISKETRLLTWKRQHIRCAILASVTTVERANFGI